MFKLIDRGNGSVALQVANGQYVSAEGGGGGEEVANRNSIFAWETFRLIDRGNGNVALQAANGQYVCAEGSGGDGVVANRNSIGAWETFKLMDPSANSAPSAPITPSGSASGIAGISYSYSTTATDSDGDTLTYTFDWGDTTTTVTGAIASGTPVSQIHSWFASGTYSVRVKATDIYGVSSGWSDSIAVSISMPNSAALRAANGQYVCARRQRRWGSSGQPQCHRCLGDVQAHRSGK